MESLEVRRIRAALGGYKGELSSDVVDTYIANPRLLYCEEDVMNLAKPAKFKHVANSAEMLFGIELEFALPVVNFTELAPLLKIGVFKYEGSITYGAEFVTLPYTYSELRASLAKLSAPIDKMLVDNSKDIENECGMHIHVSKKFLSGLEIARIVYLLSYSAGRAFWEDKASRPSNGYCEYSKLSRELRASVKSGVEPDCGWVDALGNSAYTKYAMVSIYPEDTIEFRMFKSPSTASKVVENLDLVASIIGYVKSGGYTVGGFKKYAKV